ncbi:hypothetical protein SAMN05444280_11759 [Tangfeifania diversioriginum]|uniref:Uncharacterized protein n=1 Tax=Tangfeifania diversioriginum TaxID=1168035 RepID=A0A1M6INH3_9BACT|nr:hypothetical protein [Tangfeifania diversioriginum]SHJ35889.1 hypothetical protein SAMN05444280_11759 [Tangfeifania diversioriginum]
MDDSDNQNFYFPLLKHWFRYAGAALLLIAGLAGYLYFAGGKPDFFTTKVFAFLTSYMETRTFVVAQTNLLDETAAVFLTLGLIFIGFSSERNEKPELNTLRIKALIYAVFISSGIWIACFLFIYGWPVFLFATSVFPLFLLAFIVGFRILIFKFHKTKNNHSFKTD